MTLQIPTLPNSTHHKNYTIYTNGIITPNTPITIAIICNRNPYRPRAYIHQNNTWYKLEDNQFSVHYFEVQGNYHTEPEELPNYTIRKLNKILTNHFLILVQD